MRRRMTSYWLGRVPYDEALRLQEELVQRRHEDTIGDVVLFLEHEPVITVGRNGKSENVLAAEDERVRRNVALFETGRGGDVTYHGPGQLVAYPILDLKPERCDVRRYVGDLARVMVLLANDHGVVADVIPDDPKLIGVWVDQASPREWDADKAKDASIGVPNGARLAKIGAIGVRLSHWITMHGFAFNAATDLSAFQLIVPCGIRALDVTSLAQLGVAPPDLEDLASAAARHFSTVFDADVAFGDPADLRALANEADLLSRPREA